MRHFLLSLCLLVGGVLLLALTAPALAAPLPRTTTARPFAGSLSAQVALAPLRPHIDPTPTPCDSNDPKACANQVSGQFNKLYQVIFLVGVILAIAIAVILLIVSAIRGMIAAGQGESHVIYNTIMKAIAIIILLVIAIESPNIINLLLNGAGQSITPPSLPTVP